MRHGVVAALCVAAIAVMSAAPAAARQPNQQACLGEDIRGYAQGGSQFGAFVAVVADGGAGAEILAHLAGLVPDETIPNTCND